MKKKWRIAYNVYPRDLKINQKSYIYLPLPVKVCFSIKDSVGLGTTLQQHLLKRLDDLVHL